MTPEQRLDCLLMIDRLDLDVCEVIAAKILAVLSLPITERQACFESFMLPLLEKAK